MKRENKTRYAVLGLLSIGEVSGYDINKFIKEHLSFFWKESFGQIYPTLKRLKDNSLIKERVGMPDYRGRKVYSITDKGRDFLTSYLEKTPDDEVIRNELLLKLFLASNCKEETIKSHIENELKRREAITLKHKKINIDHRTQCIKKEDERYWKHCLNFANMYNDMVIKWCKTVIDDLEKGENNE